MHQKQGMATGLGKGHAMNHGSRSNPLFFPSLPILVIKLKHLRLKDIFSIHRHFLDALEFLRAKK